MLRNRTYGTSGPLVVVLHGGPGAPGCMAPVARGLADRFRVIEPFQRGSGAERLSVGRHVADLRELIESQCAGEKPALVGSSWGAMLALAFAAAHPGVAGALVLIGCGTFDKAARARLQETLQQRRQPAISKSANWWQSPAFLRMYAYDLATTETEIEAYDARANRETWDDMVRLQEAGVYPSAFSAIRAPVLMLHGAADPHPGRMILASLRRIFPVAAGGILALIY